MDIKLQCKIKLGLSGLQKYHQAASSILLTLTHTHTHTFLLHNNTQSGHQLILAIIFKGDST